MSFIILNLVKMVSFLFVKNVNELEPVSDALAVSSVVAYYKNREKRTALMKERYLTHKDEVYKTSKLLKQKYPLKAKARTSVSNAIYTGKLKKGVCYVCSDTKVHGHHNDYSKPLDVIWACPKHHGLLHRKHK